MKNYIAPSAEILWFESEEITTVSNNDPRSIVANQYLNEIPYTGEGANPGNVVLDEWDTSWGE